MPTECRNPHPDGEAMCDKTASNHHHCSGWSDRAGGFVDWPNPHWTPRTLREADPKTAERKLRTMAAKLSGAAGSERAAKGWTATEQQLVEAAITEAAEKHGEFTTDAVWAILGDTVPKTAGMAALLKRAESKGFITKTDCYADSTRERDDHDAGRRLVVWRSRMS